MKTSLSPLLAVLAACGGVVDPELPTGHNSTAPLELRDRYALNSHVQVPPTLALPQQGYEAVEALRGLSTNPAKTLFDLAEAAGVDQVGTVRDVLPDVLEGELYGWMNELILKRAVDATPVPQRISRLADDLARPFTSFELETGLTVLPAPSRHTLTAVVFTPLSGDAVSVPALVQSTVGNDTLTVTREGDGVELSDHAFGLPLGEYAITYADLLVQRELQAASLRDAVGELIGCPEVTAQLAQKCLGFLCVGHQAELSAVCEQGLDAVVAKVHQKLKEQDLNAVHFESGRATLGAGDALTGGQWQAQLSIGLGERPAPATFEGTVAE